MNVIDVDVDYEDVLTPVVVVPALSLGNVLKKFPDFLFCVLPYIADRVVWNSIAASNKDIYDQSKSILPPWPLYYKLLSGGDRWSWSPCGTRIACRVQNSNIAIIDQRGGPFRNNRNDNNDFGWSAHDNFIAELKFSPDGRFLVSIDYYGFIRLWDNVTGNYDQLQEWNMVGEFVEMNYGDPQVFISACSKYIVVSLGTCLFLKDVENGGKTTKSLMAPFLGPNENRTHIDNIVFSFNDRAIFICCREPNDVVAIKVWRPYLDDDDEDHLIILWRDTISTRAFLTITFSNDNTMVAIHNNDQEKGTVWSIDMDHKCLIHRSDIEGITGLCFTPDGKYIVCNTQHGPIFWSIAKNEVTDSSTIRVVGDENNTNNNLRVKHISPNNRQLIVHESGNIYITSCCMK